MSDLLKEIETTKDDLETALETAKTADKEYQAIRTKILDLLGLESTETGSVTTPKAAHTPTVNFVSVPVASLQSWQSILASATDQQAIWSAKTMVRKNIEEILKEANYA